MISFHLMFVQGAIRIEFVGTLGTNEGAVVLSPVSGQLRRRAARVVAEDAFEAFYVGMMRASYVFSVMRDFLEGLGTFGRLTDPHPVDVVNGALMILKSVLALESGDATRLTRHVVSRQPFDGRIGNVVSPVVSGGSEDDVGLRDSERKIHRIGGRLWK